MSKPTMKREIALGVVIEEADVIYFWATKDAAQDISEFGELGNLGSNKYHLVVDRRYDFQEVVDYINNYGNENRLDSDVWSDDAR